MKLIRVIATVLLFVFCLHTMVLAQEANSNQGKQVDYSLLASKTLTSRSYILGPNDIISIKIFNVPQFDQEDVRIQPDGKVIITPLGSLKVAGYTIDDLHQLLVEKYKHYLKNPEVSVNLINSRPFIVYITGAVMNPGSYELNTSPDKSEYIGSTKPEILIERKTPLLSNVLVAAGGIAYDADLEHIQVTNATDNSKFQINLLDLLENSNTAQDIYLIPGDSVHIPRLQTPLAISDEKYKKYAGATFSPHTVPVKVLGYVNNPGLIKLDPAHSLNLNSAISEAGGYLKDSAYAPKKVYISRADTSGKLVTKVVNPMSNDIVLMPNDIVYVPEKSRPMTGKAFDYLTRIVSPINSVASGYNNWALMFNPSRFQFVGY